MTDMADVLAEHLPIYRWSPVNGQMVWACSSGICNIIGDDLTRVINHQAAALSAAGFGPVNEARAGALEDAAEELDATASLTSYNSRDEVTQTWLNAATSLRARAAAERGGE